MPVQQSIPVFQSTDYTLPGNMCWALIVLYFDGNHADKQKPQSRDQR